MATEWSLRWDDIPSPLIERLSPRRKARLAAEVLTAYARVRAVMARRDLTATVAALRDTDTPIPEESALTHLRAARLAWAVRRTLRVLPTDTRCLMQSLVLTSLLARRGIQTTLIIGVASEPNFQAHAWVEYCGHALLPDEQDLFQQLTRI